MILWRQARTACSPDAAACPPRRATRWRSGSRHPERQPSRSHLARMRGALALACTGARSCRPLRLLAVRAGVDGRQAPAAEAGDDLRRDASAAGGLGHPLVVEPCEKGDACGGARLACCNRPLTCDENAEGSTLRREMATPDRSGIRHASQDGQLQQETRQDTRIFIQPGTPCSPSEHEISQESQIIQTSQSAIPDNSFA